MCSPAHEPVGSSDSQPSSPASLLAASHAITRSGSPAGLSTCLPAGSSTCSHTGSTLGPPADLTTTSPAGLPAGSAAGLPANLLAQQQELFALATSFPTNHMQRDDVANATACKMKLLQGFEADATVLQHLLTTLEQETDNGKQEDGTFNIRPPSASPESKPSSIHVQRLGELATHSAKASEDTTVLPASPPDCLILASRLQPITVHNLRLALPTFRGYVEIANNTCGAAMLAGGYNAVFALDSSADESQVELGEIGLTPMNFNVLCREFRATNYYGAPSGQVSLADGAAGSATRAVRRKRQKKVKNLAWGLQTLADVAQESLQQVHTQQQRSGAASQLESRAKRLTNAVRQLQDKHDPCTWSIGNLEIERAFDKLKVPQVVIASRNVPLATADELWTALLINFNGATALESGPRRPIAQGNSVLLFHLHGVLSGSTFGHFASIFALIEFIEASSRDHKRKLLTARSYQAPRHWVDVEVAHKWIYGLKFTGYEIRRIG